MIRCYKFFAIPASRKDADLLYGQLRLAGDYRHELVEIENRSRRLHRALWYWALRSFSPWERKAYYILRGEGRPSLKAAGRFPRAVRAATTIQAAIKAWSASDVYQEYRARIVTAQRDAARAARNVASERRLHYGTYWLVEDAVSAAIRTTKWGDDLGHHACNRIGAPISSDGKPQTDQLGESHTRFQLHSKQLYALGERIDGYRIRADGEFRNRSGQIAARRLSLARIRVGSGVDDDRRAPIWADLHVLMHRPLPAGVVTGAWAQRRMVGGRAKWDLVLSVDVAEGAITKPTPAPSDKRVAIDIGWRRRDNGTRVAYWMDTDGNEAELVIPTEVENRKSKCADLRSIRDQWQNRVKVALADWKSIHPDGVFPPEHRDLFASLAHVAQWKRVGNFVRLERTWSACRMPGDAGVYELLVEYLRKDRHLHAWEGNNLERMQNQIHGPSGILITWAHELARDHGVIVIESFSLRNLKESDTVAGGIAARSIQRLAPGEIRSALKQAAERYGCQIIEIPAANTTRECPSCHVLRTSTAALEMKCDSCGMVEDQDRSAARNLLAASGDVQRHATEAKDRRKLGARRNRRRTEATART